MKAKTLHIKKPSRSLLDFVRNLQRDKEQKQMALVTAKPLLTIKK